LTTRLPVLRAIGVIALIVSALAFAACGGDDEGALSADDYREQAQEISDEFEADFEGSVPNATSEDPQKSLAGVKQIAQSSGEAARELDELEPPDEYQAVHDNLVGTLRTLEDRGEKVEQAAEGQDRAAIQSAVGSFQQGIRDLDRVGKEFDQKVGTT
jgi:hypothetical protein